MGSKGLTILGVILLSVLISTLLLWVIVERGNELRVKDSAADEQLKRFNETVQGLQSQIAALNKQMNTKADTQSVLTTDQFREKTQDFIRKGELPSARSFASAQELQTLRSGVVTCLKTLRDGKASLDRTESSSAATDPKRRRSTEPDGLRSASAACDAWLHGT